MWGQSLQHLGHYPEVLRINAEGEEHSLFSSPLSILIYFRQSTSPWKNEEKSACARLRAGKGISLLIISLCCWLTVFQLVICHPFPSSHQRRTWSSTSGETAGRLLHSWRPGNSRWKRVLCFTWSPPLHLHRSLFPFNSSIELAFPSSLLSVLQDWCCSCSDIALFVI